MSKLRQIPNTKYKPEMFDIYCFVPGCESCTREHRLKNDGWLEVRVIGKKGIGTFRLTICPDHYQMLAIDPITVAKALSLGFEQIYLQQETTDELS